MKTIGIVDCWTTQPTSQTKMLTSNCRSTDVDNASTAVMAITAVEICKLETFIVYWCDTRMILDNADECLMMMWNRCAQWPTLEIMNSSIGVGIGVGDGEMHLVHMHLVSVLADDGNIIIVHPRAWVQKSWSRKEASFSSPIQFVLAFWERCCELNFPFRVFFCLILCKSIDSYVVSFCRAALNVIVCHVEN